MFFTVDYGASQLDEAWTWLDFTGSKALVLITVDKILLQFNSENQ